MKEISMHILDLLTNSVRADATEIKISIIEDSQNDTFSFTIEDDGKGISPEMLATIKDPFTTSRTMRKVGLGIPLMTDTCRLCNGDLTIESTVNVGTTLYVTMELNHIDKPPMGDLGATMAGVMSSYENINFIFSYKKDDDLIELTTQEILDELEGVSITSIEVIRWIKDYINESI